MKSERLDCILTDIKIPGMNGMELYRAIKERQPELPVAGSVIPSLVARGTSGQ